jgi:hypothetical protein
VTIKKIAYDVVYFLDEDNPCLFNLQNKTIEYKGSKAIQQEERKEV